MYSVPVSAPSLSHTCHILQAILGRKLVIKELFDVMRKVAQLSITSDTDNVRSQCRQVGISTQVILFNSFASGIGRLSCSSCWTTRWIKSCRPISSCTLRILGTCGHGKGSVIMGVVAFILCWCRYSEQSGRESVIEFLVIVFKKFPEVYVIAVGEGRRRGRSSWACDG